VDLIVHYDVVVSSTRKTQRNGRTGRRRPGRVVQLYVPGEEKKLDKAHVCAVCVRVCVGAVCWPWLVACEYV
jgi:ERCC4-related helicase